MRRRLPLMFTLALGVGGGALLGGCGSGTKTVTVSDAPTSSSDTGAAGTPSKQTNPAKSAPATATTLTQSAKAPARTAPEPAFTGSGSSSAGQPGLSSAVAAMQAHGFTPLSTSDYHSQQTLRVLIGARAGTGGAHAQQAFFFLDGRYLGTDTSQPSASLRVVDQSDTAITLAYPLYRAHDASCCPSGGHANVRFVLDNGRLTPLDAIPPASSSTALSRLSRQ